MRIMTENDSLRTAQLTARITSELSEKLDELAAAYKASRSTVMQMAIEEFIQRHYDRRCPGCGALIPAARYCGECGTPVGVEAHQELRDALEVVRGTDVWNRILECVKSELEKEKKG